MPVQLKWVGYGLLAAVAAVCAARISLAQLSDSDRYSLQLLVEDEVWRPAGPREAKLAGIVIATLQGQNRSAVVAVVGELRDWISRGWIGPVAIDQIIETAGPLEQSSGPLSGLRLIRSLGELRALARLSQVERIRMYQHLIETRTTDEPTATNWIGASLAALRLGADELRPQIDRALNTGQLTPGEESTGEQLKAVYFPLSEARSAADPCAALADLVAANVDRTRWLEFDDAKWQPADRLVWEALLTIVRRGDCAVRPRLVDLWRSFPANMAPDEYAREYAADIAAGRADREPTRRGLHASFLVRAIRCLGDPSFQRRNEGGLGWATPDQARERLSKHGIMKSVADHEQL